MQNNFQPTGDNRVMLRGKWLPKTDLQKMLADVAALHREIKTQANETISTEPVNVIVLRHAEALKDGAQNPSLSENGKAQVEELIKTVENTGVAAVFTTQFNRTRETGQRVADHFKIPLIPVEINGQNIAAYPKMLAERIRAEYAGKTVMVIGHSNTVPPIVEAFSGKMPPLIDDATELDAIYFVSSKKSGEGSVMKARYGKK